MREQALGRGAVEEVGAVLQGEGEGLVDLRGQQREVELRGRRLDRHRLELQGAEGEPRPREPEGKGGERREIGGRRLLERQHGLHERRPAGVALRLQALRQEGEGVVLPGECVEAGAAHPRQQLRARRLAGEVGAQGDRVDEVADHPGPALGAAAGGGGADQEVLLPAVAREEGLEAGEEDHERCAPRLLGPALQGGERLRRETGAAGAAAEALERRPRPVGRQLERRRAGQPLAPLLRQPLAARAGEQALLSAGVVAVVGLRYLQGGQGAGIAPPAVEGPQLARHHRERPEVGRHVVHGEREPRRVAAGQQGGAEERPAFQVERPEQLCGEPGAHVGLRPDLDPLEVDRRRAVDALHRPVRPRGIRRAQGGMPVDQRLERAKEGIGVHCPYYARRPRNVVGRALRRQAMEEPERPLVPGQAPSPLGGGGRV